MFMNYLWSLCCIHEYHLPSLMCSWHPETIFDLFFNFSHSLISQFIVSYFIEYTASDLYVPALQVTTALLPVWPLFFFYLCNTLSLVAFCGKPVYQKYIYWIELREPEGNLNVLIVFNRSWSNFTVWGEKRCLIYLVFTLYWSYPSISFYAACFVVAISASPPPSFPLVSFQGPTSLKLFCFTNGCYTLPPFLSNFFCFFFTDKSRIDESWLAR